MIPAITAFRETRVRITVKSVTEPVTASVTDSSGADAHSRDDQVINNVYNTRYRYASAEPNCWKLDGSTVLQPDAEQTDAEVGFVSEAVSDGDGEYTSPPYVEVTIDPVVEVKGLAIAFDLLDNEYAVTFDVYLEYGSSETDTVNVTDNDKPIYNLVGLYEDLSLVKVTVNSWSAVSKKAKITEIGFGLVEQFGTGLTEPLLNVNCTDEVDITLAAMPYGELVFEFYDVNGDFSVLTPTDRTLVFTDGTTIAAELGVKTADGSFEYLLAGTYHFDKWTVSKSKVVQVRAIDLIGRQGPKVPMEATGNRTKTSAYNAVLSFLDEASFKFPTNVEVDTDYFPNTGTDFLEGPYAGSVLDELIMLGQWSMTIPCVDNTGTLKFIPIPTTAGRTIDINNVFEDPRLVRYDQICGIRVFYYDVAVSSDITEIATASGAFGESTYLVFNIGYNYEFYDVVAYGGAAVESSPGFEFGNYTVEVSGTGGVTIRGKAWAIGKQFYEAPSSAAVDAKAVWIEVDNPHICTLERATAVATWLLAIYDRMAEVDFGWRGTPEVETMDMVNLEPVSGTEVDAIVVKHEWKHDGALEYRTKAAAMALHVEE
jgi:hypothetical protein